ncbi:MAG: nucleotidyl transferase AbiEii/AbiGii toxin family protein [Kiritimatiellia bacterium]|nr:nucleotidyl transferase AbiEii/AbiGii toxin family protein [Kiritimatiellia bacterium]
MNLFDQLVEQAMRSENALKTVRPAVEKELLHHDILREMSRAGWLARLTFIGGTCLRTCYGSPRLSEDLDFAGGPDFVPDRLAELGPTLEKALMGKYGLPVRVSPPVREEGEVSTWKVRLQTRPTSKHLPAQRIHIDICAVPSHRARPALLRNAYGVNMGTEGLILQVESREEILADKWVALAFRPNRVKYRDLWDMIWLDRQGSHLEETLVFQKLNDRKRTRPAFLSVLRDRIDDLENHSEHQRAFRKEMDRFLFASDLLEATQRPDFWSVLILHLREHATKMASYGPRIGWAPNSRPSLS